MHVSMNRKLRLAALCKSPARYRTTLSTPSGVTRDGRSTHPRPYEPRPADSGVETQHVELLLPGRIDHDDGYRAIRRTGGPQPRIAHARDLGAVTPGPIALMLQVLPLHLAP